TEDAGPSGSALEFDGAATIRDSRVVGNTVLVTSPDGVAGALGAISAFTQAPEESSMRDTLVAGNAATAISETGAATVQGAGITNNGVLGLTRVAVVANSGHAEAPSGFVQGGGIWNDLLFFDPPVTLTLEQSLVARNTLTATDGIDVQGGGLFTGFPVALD